MGRPIPVSDAAVASVDAEEDVPQRELVLTFDLAMLLICGGPRLWGSDTPE